MGGSGNGCAYSDVGKAENRYVIEIAHTWADFRHPPFG